MRATELESRAEDLINEFFIKRNKFDNEDKAREILTELIAENKSKEGDPCDRCGHAIVRDEPYACYRCLLCGNMDNKNKVISYLYQLMFNGKAKWGDWGGSDE